MKNEENIYVRKRKENQGRKVIIINDNKDKQTVKEEIQIHRQVDRSIMNERKKKRRGSKTLDCGRELKRARKTNRYKHTKKNKEIVFICVCV